MKKTFTLTGVMACLIVVALAPGVPDIAAAHPPKSSCFSTFRHCRQYCVNRYAPDEGDPIVWNPEANACLLDCDLDVARCIIERLGGRVVEDLVKKLD